MVKIYIDPGHGGSDPGAVDNGLKEKDLVLKIAKEMQSLLNQYENVQVKLSRTGDTYPSLSQRTNDANKWGADAYVSPHINAGGGKGYEDFRYNGVSLSSKTGKLHKAMHDSIMDKVSKYGMPDRGMKTGNFHVIRESKMPAILTENGFIDNSADAKNLKKDAFIKDVAQGHVNGLVKYFGLKKKNVKPSNPAPSNPSGDTYAIKKGDTFYSLEKKWGMKSGTLQKLNPKVDPKELKVGQKINISEAKTNKDFLIRVKADNLWVYNKADWNAKDFTVKEDDVYTVVKTLTVSGSKMYQLKSGLYITANNKYVEKL